jgi:hypothetical protein
MRSLLLVLAFALFTTTGSAAEMPPKVNNLEGWLAWEAYSKDLVIRLFPKQAPFLANNVIGVIDRPEPNLTTIGPLVLVNIGYILFVQDESEYAAGLAHEISHLNRGHRSFP